MNNTFESPLQERIQGLPPAIDKHSAVLILGTLPALWDILDSAVRETSSDKDLMDEKPNDLPHLLEDYPSIKLLLFHSNSAYKYFKRFFKNTAVPYICISSPSGQNRKGTEEKATEWRTALSCAIPKLQGKSRLSWKERPPL